MTDVRYDQGVVDEYEIPILRMLIHREGYGRLDSLTHHRGTTIVGKIQRNRKTTMEQNLLASYITPLNHFL